MCVVGVLIPIAKYFAIAILGKQYVFLQFRQKGSSSCMDRESTKYKTGRLRAVYPKKYAHVFYCFAALCCGYTLTDFPISIRLTSLALWQSNDCPSASKATLMNINSSWDVIMNDYLTATKPSTTKPCAYFLGYTVHMGSLELALSNQISWWRHQMETFSA